MFSFGEDADVGRYRQVVFKLIGRSEGNLEKVGKIGACVAAAAFGDIGRYRKAGPSDLLSEIERESGWESGYDVFKLDE